MFTTVQLGLCNYGPLADDVLVHVVVIGFDKSNRADLR